MEPRLTQGVEIEGRFRGLRTLLIPAALLFEGIHLMVAGQFPHYYFGAHSDMLMVRHLADICSDKYRLLAFLATRSVVTLEVNALALESVPAELLCRHSIRVIATLKYGNNAQIMSSENIEVKLVGGNRACVFSPGPVLDFTYAKDSLYASPEAKTN